MQTNLEKQKNEENSNIEKTQSMLSDLNQEIEDNKQIDNEETEKNDEEKKTNSFTFKPIGIGLTGSEIKNGKDWAENLTTTIEFAGGYKNLDLYGYARKDWNKFAKGFNEGIELFTTENLNLGKNFALNGKQFYWGKGAGEIMAGPQISGKKQIGNAEIGATLGEYGTYDAIPSQKDRISLTGTVSINFSIKQKNGKTRNGDAFLNLNGQDFNFNNYGTYGEANLETPNFLDPEVAGQLCGIIQARYGGNVKEIELKYLGVGLKYKF